MAKYFLKIESDGIKCKKLKKGERPMMTWYSALYRVDDRFFAEDVKSSNSFIVYDHDSSQFYSAEGYYLDSGLTQAFIQSAKNNKSKKKVWMNLDKSNLGYYFSIIIVIGAIALGFFQ